MTGLYDGAEVVLGPDSGVLEPGPEQQFINQKMRPGSGVLSVQVLPDGPTRVLQVRRKPSYLLPLASFTCSEKNTLCHFNIILQVMPLIYHVIITSRSDIMKSVRKPVQLFLFWFVLFEKISHSEQLFT